MDLISKPASRVEADTGSWGVAELPINVVSLRRYNALLHKLDSFSEIVCFIAMGALPCVFTAMMLNTNFENLIFFDGTSLYCVMDGSNGKIITPDNTVTKQ